MPYRSPEANHNFSTSSSQIAANIPRYTPKPLLFAPSGPKASNIGFDLQSKDMGNSSAASNRKRQETPRSDKVKSPNDHHRNLSHNIPREQIQTIETYPKNNNNGSESRSLERSEVQSSSKLSKISKTLPANISKTHRKLASFSGFSKSLNSTTSSMASTIPSNSGASQKIKVAIIFNQSFTVAGSELTGQIEFTCLAKDSVRAADIHLDLTGKEELNTSSITSSSSTSRLDTETSSTSKVFYRTRLLIQDRDHPCPLARETGKPDSEGYWPLRRGKTTIPFLLRLASTLPNAMSTPRGKVVYSLELSVHHKTGIFKETTGFSRGVNILERWEPKEVLAYRQRGVRAETRKKLFMGGQSHLEISAELVASLVVAGSLAYVRITVKNPTSKKAQGIRIKLLQRLDKVEVDLPSREISEKTFNDADVKFPAGETRHCLLAMEIPSHCLSLRHTSFLHADYTLQIVLISSLSKDLVIDLPIYISHPASWNDPCPSLFSSSNPEIQASSPDELKGINLPRFRSPEIAPVSSDSIPSSVIQDQIIFDTEIDPGYSLSKTHRPRRSTSEEHMNHHYLKDNVQENRPHSSLNVEKKPDDKKPTFKLNPKTRAPLESLASGSSFPFSAPISLNTTNLPESPDQPQFKLQSPSSLSRVVSPPSFFRGSKAESSQTRDRFLETPEPSIDPSGEFMVLGGRKYQLVSSSTDQSRPHTVSIPDQPYQMHNRKSPASPQEGNSNTTMRHSSYIPEVKEQEKNYRQNEIGSSPETYHIQDTGFEGWNPISAADEFSSELSSVYGFMEPSLDRSTLSRIIPTDTSYSETITTNINEAPSKSVPREEQYNWSSENQNPRMSKATHHSTEQLDRRSRRVASIKHKNSIRVRTRGPIRRSIVPPGKQNDTVDHDLIHKKSEYMNEAEQQDYSTNDNFNGNQDDHVVLSTSPKQEAMESQLNQLQQQMAILLQAFQTGNQHQITNNQLSGSNGPNSYSPTQVKIPKAVNSSLLLNSKSVTPDEIQPPQEPSVKTIPDSMSKQPTTQTKKPKKKTKAPPLSKSRALQHHLNVLNRLHESEDDSDWV